MMWLSGFLLLGLVYAVEPEPVPEPDWDHWGSGLQELLHSFPADSPFVSETAGRPVNCTQRYWLPPSSPICWDNIAEPEEFEESRLLALQNRAALRSVVQASGVAEGGASYKRQAEEDIRAIRADHLAIVETAETMQKVFSDLEEKRRDGSDLWTFSSLKERLGAAKDSIHSRSNLANALEEQLGGLERSLEVLQTRLVKLLPQP